MPTRVFYTSPSLWQQGFQSVRSIQSRSESAERRLNLCFSDIRTLRGLERDAFSQRRGISLTLSGSRDTNETDGVSSQDEDLIDTSNSYFLIF